MKKVSVIVPCYNVGHEIDRLMDCLVKQTIGLEDIEIVLVNDGSKDDTLERLMAWEQSYEENIMVINCNQNCGMSYARNIALDIVSGEYVSFLDGDDWITPNYLERMLEISEKYQSDIAICGHDRPGIFREESNISVLPGEEDVYTISQTSERRKFLAAHVFSTSVCWELYRREFIEKYGLRFPVGVHYEDAYFCYIAYMLADVVCECTDVLYHYYRNPHGTIIGDSEQERRERLVTLRMFYDQCVYNDWLELYHDEIELIFIRKYFVEMLEVMFRTFEVVDYSIYCGIRDWLVLHFPDFSRNPYLEGSFSELDRLFLRCIIEEFNEQQIGAVRKAFLQIVYKKDRPDRFCRRELRKQDLPQVEELFSWLEIVCTDPCEENILKMQGLLTVVPALHGQEDIGRVAEKCEGRMTSEVYRYVIDREIFIAYLRDCLKRGGSNLSQERMEIYRRVAEGW